MYQILFQRSADYKLAERMANEILEEFGIRLV